MHYPHSLFTLCMEVIKNVKANTGTTIFHRTRQCLLYADDVVLLGCAVKHTGEIIYDWLDHKCSQNQLYD